MPPPHSLPLQLTSFVGREREIAEVKRLLGTSRLLTLTGAGGTGKTRLALQVANQVVADYPDGVFFVNLAPVTDPDLVVPTMAQILDIKEAAGQPLSETLKAYLQGKETLLLLDNFEQVLEAAPTVVDLLLGAPDLKVMVTSREPLHLQGEQLYQVPALELPNPNQQASVEELSQKEAVALFMERARSASPDFELTQENAPTVAQICLRLDGLPLAIELAAARIRVLTPQAMLSHLESRLTLLTGGAHDLPTRQQTLRSTIDWSYDLLDEGEKQLFRRMAVFQGGRTLEALEAVCNFDSKLDLDILEGVQALVDKSLLQQSAGSFGEPRFVMLETIHEYARGKLQESGEGEALRREHALYFMRLAEEAEPHLTGAKQQEWLDRLETEHDNIRAALRWGRESSNIEHTDLGLRLGGAVWRFWVVRGYFSEGRGALQRLLSQAALLVQPCSKEARSKALHGAGALAWAQGDNSAARSLVDDALALARELGDNKAISMSLYTLGNVVWGQGDYATARSLHEESLAIRRELGDKWGIALSLGSLGDVAYINGDYSAARSLHEEKLALASELEDKRSVAYALNSLGSVAFMQGDHATANSFYQESLVIVRELGDKWAIAWALANMGHAAFLQGDYAAARSMHQESLQIRREIGNSLGIARNLTGLGEIEVESGQPQVGARLLGASDALLEAINAIIHSDDRVLYDRAVASGGTKLGKEAFEKARQQGRAMSMEQAIAYGLQAMSEPKYVATPQAAPKQRYPNELSRREVEVLRLLALGLSNQQIAERLFLTINTVRAHLYSIYNKLDVSNRGAAIRIANEHQLV